MTAAIDFPNSPPPSDGDTFTAINGITYRYNNGKWKGIVNSGPADQLINGLKAIRFESSGILSSDAGNTIRLRSSGQGGATSIEYTSDVNNQTPYDSKVEVYGQNVHIHTAGDLNVWSFDAYGTLTLPKGSVLGETTTTTIITPPSASAGQSLVIRPTSTGSLSASGNIVPGTNLTITLDNDSGTLDTTGINYIITGATAQQLGIGSLTGTFPSFSPSGSYPQTATVVLPIPSNSSATTFTLTIAAGTGFSGTAITVTDLGVIESSHIHLISGDPTTVDLYLGDDDQYVKIEKNGGAVVVGTNTNTNHWTFDSNGTLTLPGGLTFPGNYYIGGGEGSLAISSPEDPISIIANAGINSKLWQFGADGSITFPDDTAQTTAYRNRPLTNLNLSGGTASTVFEIDMTYVDCGGSYLRGILAQDQYDGYDNGSTTTSFDKVLDGGQA